MGPFKKYVTQEDGEGVYDKYDTRGRGYVHLVPLISWGFDTITVIKKKKHPRCYLCLPDSYITESIVIPPCCQNGLLMHVYLSVKMCMHTGQTINSQQIFSCHRLTHFNEWYRGQWVGEKHGNVWRGEGVKKWYFLNDPNCMFFQKNYFQFFDPTLNFKQLKV